MLFVTYTNVKKMERGKIDYDSYFNCFELCLRLLCYKLQFNNTCNLQISGLSNQI